jgi:nanoRNase/pAp phosphatase (c-di-AMP/oligoRNAs hydrolase)
MHSSARAADAAPDQRGANVSGRQDVQHDSRPVLLVLSESPSVQRQVRSYHRDVRRWLGTAEAAAPDGFTGDPTASATYAWLRAAHGVTAVIDLTPPERARGALRALRRVRGDAAVLLLSDAVEDLDHEGDGTLARPGALRDVLRLDLDDELQRLEAERRAFCLREFAAGAETVPILIHRDPDPDAVSSALGVAWLLGGSPDRTPIVTLGPITRPENRRMVDLLRIRVTNVTEDELRGLDRVITVDTQPRKLQKDGRPRLAVIDHHPPENDYSADFADIRPEYGATATMITEYLRAGSSRRIGRSLATALLYGIRTDTDSLTRGVTPADVAAYGFLQERADLHLVHRFDRPSYAAATARLFGSALAQLECDHDLCVSYIGELAADEVHVLADLADFCLGVESAAWAVAAAIHEGELVLTLRHAGGGGGRGGAATEGGAGGVARVLARFGGSGGGHAAMARVTLPVDRARELLGGADAGMAGAIRRLIRRAIGELDEASRPESRPAPRA